ncbi:MAG: ABC transporter ATP-binding protein [Phycisphaerales bacterium]
MATVTLQSVRKVYDNKVCAVEGFDLDIRDGEFVVFVGPSGCGKSTTLRMIAGLEEITSGRIDIGGRVVNDVHPKDRDIAMVFQNYALYPHMNVYKNMAFGLTLRKLPRAEIKQRVEEAARLLGLEAFLDRKPKALSGGQRQRVALGRAIVREPKVFLFDEPLSNLDAKLRVTTRTELKNLHQRLKTTTIYVTHDQEEAMTLGDRIVVMSAGRIQQVDTPLNIYRRPTNRFVASFLGAPPMNFVEGKLVREGGGPVFDGGEGLRLRMTAHASDRLMSGGHEGKPLVMGFRPSAMSEQAIGKFAGPPGGGNSVTLRSETVEPLGEKIDVACVATGGGVGGGGKRLMARIDAREHFPINEAVTFYLDMDHVHVFEPGEFGRNLTV